MLPKQQKSQEIRVAQSNPSSVEEQLAPLSHQFTKEVQISDEGISEYGVGHSFHLSQIVPSLQTYGQPSTITQNSEQSTTALDGRFVNTGNLDEESEDKAILNWLYKDEESSTSTSNIIEANQYGK